MAINRYEDLLTGGHPNSLGNTIEVVNDVLTDEKNLKDLYDCYESKDEVVRLRVSNGMKRICKEHPDWVAKYLDDLIEKTSKINQASTKWTLSTLFMWLDNRMTEEQRENAIAIMKKNLHFDDWIVQNTTSESLAHFAKHNSGLRQWLLPELKILTKSRHKSVARRAQKLIEMLPSAQT